VAGVFDGIRLNRPLWPHQVRARSTTQIRTLWR